MQNRPIELGKRPGKIEVAPSAMAMTAVRVVRACDGVVGIADRKLRHGKAVVLDDQHLLRGVSVAIHGESIAVEIFVVLEYGERISTVATAIVDAIRTALARMLPTASIQITVHVQGLLISG